MRGGGEETVEGTERRRGDVMKGRGSGGAKAQLSVEAPSCDARVIPHRSGVMWEATVPRRRRLVVSLSALLCQGCVIRSLSRQSRGIARLQSSHPSLSVLSVRGGCRGWLRPTSQRRIETGAALGVGGGGRRLSCGLS